MGSQRVGHIQSRFYIQQHTGFELGTGQHLSSVQSARSRQRIHQLRPHRVARFGEVTHRCAGLFCDPIRYREQTAGLRVLGSRIAKQDGFAFAAEQRRRDGLRCWTCHSGPRRWHTFAGRHAAGDLGQNLDPFRRSGHQVLGHWHQPIVLQSVQAMDVGTLLGGLTQTLCEQWVVFAQERAHHQHALQLRE